VVADRKAAEQAAADQRARDVAARILALNAQGDVHPDATPTQIEERMAEVRASEMEAEDFDHRHGEAIALKDRVLVRLQEALNRAVAAEEREQQIIRDREAFQKELDAARKEAERLAAQKRADDDARATAAAEADAQRQREQAQRDQEAAARGRINDLRRTISWSLTAKAAEIRTEMQVVADMNQAIFHPLEHEALAVHEEVTNALPVALAMAEERERTAAERAAKEARSREIQDRINVLSGAMGAFATSFVSMERVVAARKALNEFVVDEEKFGDRVPEVQQLVEDQKLSFNAIYEARLRDQEQQRERDRLNEEAAAQESARTRRDAVMRMNGETLHALLEEVSNDPDFLHLDAHLCGRIDAKLADIAAAL
jgi:hypothetical protein